jgi:hypothetical protein
MATFIELNALTQGENSSRPVKVNLDAIAHYQASDNQYDLNGANGTTAIYFVGGLRGQAERLVVKETVAQVDSAIADATS